MKYNKIVRYNKLKEGFTLIELLAVIIVLSLILIIVLGIFGTVRDDVDMSIDKATKNIILTAANEYAIEFRGSDTWNEEIKVNDDNQNVVSFCISLDSMLEQGYFKNDGSNYEKYRNKYAVKAWIVNGVYKYEFVNLDEVTDDNDICKYARKDSSLIEISDEIGEYKEVDKISNSVEIYGNDNENKLGEFDYNLSSLKNNKYSINLDLDMKLDDIIVDNSNIYVNVLLDESGSMKEDNKYTNAKKTIKQFSEKLSELGANVSLIGFGDFPSIRRGYSTEKIVNDDFISNVGSCGTNGSGGMDMVTALMYNTDIGKNSKIFTIMLFDGVPCDYLSLIRKSDGKSISSYDSSMTNGGYNLDTNDLAKEYYTNYIDAVDECQDKRCKLRNCNKTNEDYIVKVYSATDQRNGDWAKLEHSSKFLKSLGSKLIIVGYGVDFGSRNSIKNVVSNEIGVDDEERFCVDSDLTDYCYYYGSNGNEINTLFDRFANNIETLSSIDRVKLSLESLKDENGIPLVKIYDKDGGEVTEWNEIVLENVELTDGMVNIKDNYTFVINKDANLFNEKDMKCIDKVCTYDGSLKLLDVKLGLHYSSDEDNIWNYVDIVQPEFYLKLTKINTIN